MMLRDFDLPDALRVRQSARAQLLKVAIPELGTIAIYVGEKFILRDGFAVALCEGAWYCVDKRAILQDGREKAHSVPMYRREKLPVIRNACAERGAGALRWVLRGVDGLAPAEACLGGGPRRRVEQVGEHTSAALRRCARDSVDGGVDDSEERCRRWRGWAELDASPSARRESGALGRASVAISSASP